MEKLNQILIYIFIFVDIFAALGFFLMQKDKKNGEVKIRKSSFCPCKRMAENGVLSTLCMYLAMGGFLYSATSVSLIGFSKMSFVEILVLSVLCAILGFKLKTD